MSDRTAHRLSQVVYWKNGLLYLCAFFCVSSWGGRLQAQLFMDVAFPSGIEAGPLGQAYGETASFVDVNGDGWDDLTIARSNDSLKVYLSGPDGFELAPAPVQCPLGTLHVLWVDYDNDGDLDLYITVLGGVNRMFQNDGNFNFTDVTISSGLVTEQAFNYGASFADADRDGHLDLYMCRYYAGGDVNGLTNLYFHNNGDGTFTNLTDSLNLGNGIRASFMGVWGDFNNDLWPDLYVINDRAPSNTFYLNSGNGSFEDFTDFSNTAYPNNDPMTATVGDYNNSGKLDIFMTNGGGLFSMPPLLLSNNGDTTFSENAATLGINAPQITWGGTWIDFDNDGWRDLFFCSSDDIPNYLYQNMGGSFFLNQSAEVFAENRTSYVVSAGDFNNDGYADLIVQNRYPEMPLLLENQNSGNHYVKVNLTGMVSNKDAIGAWIHVHHDGASYHHYTLCGENFLGQNSQNILFGLGSSDSAIDSIVVSYPSGHEDIYYGLPVDSLYYLTEGETVALQIDANGALAFCPGDSVQLTATAGYAGYLWNTGDTTQSITALSSGTYSVVAVNAFGVTATDSAIVEVYPPPSVNIEINHPVCHGDSTGTVSLSNQVGTGISSVVWSNGQTGWTIDSIASGTYTFELTDLNGCLESGSAVVTEPPQMVVVVFVNDEENGNDGQVFVSVFGGTPPYTITLNGVPFEVLIENLAGGLYTLEVVDANDCTHTFDVVVGSPLSTMASDPHEALTIHPNPTSGELFIQHHLAPQSIQVLDLHGKTVYEGNGIQDGALDLGGLTPGVYTLHMSFATGDVQVRRVVKQ